MARLVEIENARRCASPLVIHSGDALLFRAAGCLIRAGRDVIEVLGAFVCATVGDNGAVFTPEGPPNVVLVRATAPGYAQIDLFTGDPFHAPVATTIEITVEA